MLAFDIEADGLLHTMTKTHCAVTIDLDSGSEEEYTPSEMVRFPSLVEAELNRPGGGVVGHNIIGFDIPALGIKPTREQLPRIVDTMVLSMLLFGDVKERDFDNAPAGMPASLYGRHGLEAWGYRLGIFKGDYGKQDNAWETFTPEMLEYCRQDVRVTVALYRHLWSELEARSSHRAFGLETMASHYCEIMVRNGYPFKEADAAELFATLSDEHQTTLDKLRTEFPPIYKSQGEFTPKRPNRTRGYVAGAPLTKVKLEEFNPASGAQIADRLIQRHGWKPKELTPTGIPKVDEDVLKGLKYPEVPLLLRYLMLDKRIGQVATGQNAWLKKARCARGDEPRIHGSIKPCGAVSGRATHSNPNVAQVPGVRAAFGKECRSLWHPGKGRLQVGTDASGLELRCLGHFLAPYDGGTFIREVLDGDIHTKNMEAAGLASRDEAKTFTYLTIYGGGPKAAQAQLGCSFREAKRKQEAFKSAIPGLRDLLSAVGDAVERRGYLLGLDGRRLHSRSPHSALNLLLQSAGALVCKAWLVKVCMLMEDEGWSIEAPHGDAYLMAWVHDELQISAKDAKAAERVCEISAEAMTWAERLFKFRCRLDVDSKIGADWAECH